MRSTCDLCDELGDAVRVVPPGLRHYGGRHSFSGPVTTIASVEDNTLLKQLAGTLGDGGVIVVAAGGSLRCALLGDQIAAEAIANGWAGVVIDGCVRDTAQLATMPLGVMALETSPRRSAKNGAGETGVTVQLHGATCAPGEMLVADDDGIVIGPADLLRA